MTQRFSKFIFAPVFLGILSSLAMGLRLQVWSDKSTELGNPDR